MMFVCYGINDVQLNLDLMITVNLLNLDDYDLTFCGVYAVVF